MSRCSTARPAGTGNARSCSQRPTSPCSTRCSISDGTRACIELRHASSTALPLLALSNELAAAFLDRRIGVCLEVGIQVPPEDATAVASIVAELVINAAKHAFPDPANAGQVLVHLSRHGPTGYRVDVEDDGCGLPESFEPGRSRGLGACIVAAMAWQLCAGLEFAAGRQGTRFTLTVPR
ncbi:ATP-binding protein [Falsiroseomonas sp. HW251]|uniref:ATP-binding protein n=1 Tax=Falsiroseomonas sp. HW251 TaxID=3390998 RepID=UPI003D310AB4